MGLLSGGFNVYAGHLRDVGAMPGKGGKMNYRPAGSWKRWIARFCWVQLQLVLGSAFVLADEVKSFNLAGLKLIPIPWDKAANFAKLEHYARKAAAAGADFIVTPEGYLERGTSVTTR
jgi:hypothetical protein